MISLPEQFRRRRAVMATIHGRRLPRRKRLPRQIFPKGVELRYLAKLLEVLRAVRRMVEQRLPVARRVVEEARGLRGDAPGDWNDEVAALRLSVARTFTADNLSTWVEPIGQDVADAQKEQLLKQVKAAIGIEVPLSDPQLAPRLDAWTAENVGLITSMSSRYLDDVQKVVTRGVADGERWETIADQITDERFGVSESQAALIARDQVGKLYGAIQQARQEDLGVTEYDWRTERDEKVRPEHAKREGERFSWGSPPEDGHPGEPINCRCTADPVLDQLLEALDE